jgi:hypothetical protein
VLDWIDSNPFRDIRTVEGVEDGERLISYLMHTFGYSLPTSVKIMPTDYLKAVNGRALIDISTILIGTRYLGEWADVAKYKVGLILTHELAHLLAPPCTYKNGAVVGHHNDFKKVASQLGGIWERNRY